QQSSTAPQSLGFNGFCKGAYSYHFHNFWWKPFDPTRNRPDLGARFGVGERMARSALQGKSVSFGAAAAEERKNIDEAEETVESDKRDLDWSAVLKRTFESYIRSERPNLYGEWLQW
ncbi:hypothetical protein DFJ43DRAFT_184868, partial [Lentinula guzmanii]